MMSEVLIVLIAILFAEINAVRYIDCNGRNDGIYAIGCSQIFVRCYLGQIYNLKCPADLKFNPDSMKCDLTDNIPLCQNEISTDQSTQTAASPIDCSSLPDGTYGNGQCSEYYIACHQGRLASMRCPSNLYYNQVSKQCDFKKNVKECITEENTPSNGLPGMDVQMPVQHQTQQSQLPQQTHTQSDSFPSFSCLNKADGVYSPQDQGCVDFFWMCTNSRTFKSACPRGLYYNRNTKQCDHKSSIAECNQFQPITAVASDDSKRAFKKQLTRKDQSDSVSYQREPQLFQNQINCLNKPNGRYANTDCALKFTFCAEGVAYEQSCPNGLVYNRMMGLCDHYDNCIRAVNPNTPMPSQIAPVAAEGFPPLEPGPVIIQQPISTTPAKEMDCTNKPDGFYSIGCSANYYACAGGSMSTFTCPANLKYDSVMKVCNYAENVPACRAAEPAKVPSAQQQVPQERKQPQQKKPSQQRDPSRNGFCASKPDGVYSNGCSVNYFICVNQITLKYVCPEGKVFNGRFSSCDIPSNVHDCSNE